MNKNNNKESQVFTFCVVLFSWFDIVRDQWEDMHVSVILSLLGEGMHILCITRKCIQTPGYRPALHHKQVVVY